MDDFHTRGDATKALIAYGSAAEKTVLGLLRNPDVFVRREACQILKQIGTKESLRPLVILANSNDGLASMAAREAAQAIQARGGR